VVKKPRNSSTANSLPSSSRFYWDFLFWLTLLIAPIGAILYIRYCHNNYLDKKRKEEITSNFS